MTTTPDLFSGYRPYWARRFGTAPFLPMSRDEMEQLGWECCDIILVTGDAYIDHPSFGMALIGRLLEAHGFRVGIICQPDWSSTDDFQRLGRPSLFFGVTAGNMDSMVNRYTADRKIRSDDAYTAGGAGGSRPDRSVIVYAQRVREAWRDVPIIIGGIEASLRRLAHYDYWSDRVRRSILLDSKADLLLFGNAERAVVEVAHHLARGGDPAALARLRGAALVVSAIPDDWSEIDGRDPESSVSGSHQQSVVRLPDYESVRDDPRLYAHASRLIHLETNPGNARALLQSAGGRLVWVNPPPQPLTSRELDRIYELPFRRRPHPAYGDQRIPAWEMIRFSVTIMRGCFGGCTFCSITEHEGRIIQNRSEESILREIGTIRDEVDGFTGIISDICVYPEICDNLDTDHSALTTLYRKARQLPGIRKVLIGSGVRYDLALRSPEYIDELVSHHVGGYLKVAPEHTEKQPLELMMKPAIGSFERFREQFERASRAAGKEQYLIPYFIAAHPGSSDESMVELALWLKQNRFRPDQVQSFLPTPMALATTMYHTDHNPLRRIGRGAGSISVARGLRARRLQKALLRYHDPKNWPLLREALRRMGRGDLIGHGKRHLVPPEAGAAGRASLRGHHPDRRENVSRNRSERNRAGATSRRRTPPGRKR